MRFETDSAFFSDMLIEELMPEYQSNFKFHSQQEFSIFSQVDCSKKISDIYQ